MSDEDHGPGCDGPLNCTCPTPIDLDFFAWRVPTPDDVDGTRLLVPHADPMAYESPFDLVFSTEDEARQAIEHFGVEEDATEQGWLLIHFVGTVIQ